MRRAGLVQWMVLVAALGLALAPVAVAAVPPGAKWDPAVEWRRYPRQMNPSPDHLANPGVWAYLGSPSRIHDPSSYYLLPHYQATSADSRVQVWQDPSAGFLHVSHVQTARGYAPALAPANGMHPGPAGQMSIIAWTSPMTGTVSIEGNAYLVDAECFDVGSGIVWWIDKGSAALFSAVMPSGGGLEFETSAAVTTGDTLYFILDPGDNDMCDTTLVNIGITAEK
jgi:hypothetical protein